MIAESIEHDFRQKVCEQVTLKGTGLGRFVVEQPFCFPDGDHFVVVLQKLPNGWVLTDEGHTLMHMDYDDVDLSSKTRARVLDETLTAFNVHHVADGALQLNVPGECFGDALFTYLQALNKVTDLAFIRRETVKSLFMSDVRELMQNLVPEDRRVFDYHDASRDPEANYSVDLLIDGVRQAEFVFFITNDMNCQQATIVCHQFEHWHIPFHATGIFENQMVIGRKYVAQFSDVAYKQIPSLSSRDRLEQYVRNEVLGCG
jgi:hypothetical protein